MDLGNNTLKDIGMKFKTISILLTVSILCSCMQQKSKSTFETNINTSPLLEWQSKIRIETEPIRGMSFSDSLGIEHSHAYITTTITNDSTLAMNFEIALSKEYQFPEPYSKQNFRVVVWPQELGYKSETFTDSLEKEVQRFLVKQADTSFILNKTIEPHEKYSLTIGTLHQLPSNCYPSPYFLFAESYEGNHNECLNFMTPNNTKDSIIKLGLRLGFSEVGCTLISCGQINYSE